METKIIKLISGEEILADIEIHERHVVLDQPMILVMKQEGLGMVPWLMLAADSQVSIGKDKIIMMYNARTEIVNNYKQQIGGIVTAPATALDTTGKLSL